MKNILLFLILLTSTTVFANCVDDQDGLKELTDADFSHTWHETTANDGKPVQLKMSSKNDKLYFVFEKSHDGVWAEGEVEVCSDKGGLVVKMAAADIKVGPKAPGLVRMAMHGGANFKVKVNSVSAIHVSTSGWSGDFVPN